MQNYIQISSFKQVFLFKIQFTLVLLKFKKLHVYHVTMQNVNDCTIPFYFTNSKFIENIYNT